MGVYMRERDHEMAATAQPPKRTPLPPAMTVAELLAFEERHPRHTGAKEEQIRVELRITPARYYQQLHQAIATREALELNPAVVHRVQDRLEQARQARRDVSTARQTPTEQQQRKA